jgi:hypothetical protein
VNEHYVKNISMKEKIIRLMVKKDYYYKPPYEPFIITENEDLIKIFIKKILLVEIKI